MGEWVFCGCVCFLAGLVQGCTGFGLALVAAPCLMLWLPPEYVVPMLVLLSTVNTAYIAYEGRRHIRPRMVARLSGGGLLGMPLGVYALRHVDPAWIKIGAGMLVLVFALALLAGRRHPIRRERFALFPVGLVAGFLGGSTSMGGPPLVLFLANQKTPRDVFRATAASYFSITNGVAIVAFLSMGMLHMPLLVRTCALLPILLMGTLAGVRLARIVSEQVFQRIVNVILAITGALLLGANLHKLFG